MNLEAPSLDVARAFVADSPFGKAGVLAEFRVRPVNWLTGRPEQPARRGALPVHQRSERAAPRVGLAPAPAGRLDASICGSISTPRQDIGSKIP